VRQGKRQRQRYRNILDRNAETGMRSEKQGNRNRVKESKTEKYRNRDSETWKETEIQ